MNKQSSGSLLKPQLRRDPPQQLSVRVSAEALSQLKLYAEFIDSDVAYVVDETLKQLFRKDNAFQEWMKVRRGTPELLQKEYDKAD
jgi:hypothetical protein